MKYLIMGIAMLGVTIAFPVDARDTSDFEQGRFQNTCHLAKTHSRELMVGALDQWDRFKAGPSGDREIKSILKFATSDISLAGHMASFYRAFCIGVLVQPTAEAVESMPARQYAMFTISKHGCQRLIQHQAHSDAEFKPGVDVRGKKVKRAELNKGSQLKLPNEFTFELKIDIAKKYGLDKKGISADMPVGIVKVRGRNIYFNDQKLSWSDRLVVAAKCQKAIRGR